MQEIKMYPVGIVRNNRPTPVDDNWSSTESTIELFEDYPEACLHGIEHFSHLEIVFYFHLSTSVILGSEHPRENRTYPKMGIFAQRKKDRPNHIGTTMVQLIRKEGRHLLVKNLDAINGTPVLDIKPVFTEFLPSGKIVQPEWTKLIMKNYW